MVGRPQKLCYVVYNRAQEPPMTASTTMTIRLPVELKERLARICEASGRSQSYHAAKALEAFVSRELPIIEGILEGMADVRAGRVVPHEQAMAELRAIVDETKSRKAA